MDDAVVLYPSPAIGHLISMVELGRLLLKHYPSFSITILVTTPPYNTGSTSSYVNRVSTTTPSITFHYLPIIPLSLDSTFEQKSALDFHLLLLNNPNVRQALTTLSQTHTIRAFVIDMFCTASFDVSTSLNIPTYYFFTSGAACLAAYLYFPTVHKTTTKSLKDLNSLSDLNIPGVPPISASDMPKEMLDRNDIAYEYLLNTFIHFAKSSGIIVNTFESLEPRAIKAISDGICVPDYPTPPVFYIGPLIAAGDRTAGGGEANECLRWLDSQPTRSVVFLCFGSLGVFSADQLREIAIGLERSGERFLWVVRSPPTEDKSKRFLEPPEPDLDALLPEGFLDRVKDRGMVLKSWAPQVAVLNHESVGGFVTHCGWNSVLEAVCAGIPMVAWPLYAEQHLNRVFLTIEMRLALRMEESENGFVSANEVEKRVRELMESEQGKAIRERVLAMRDGAIAAVSEGGSSLHELVKLTHLWKQA